jgi:hypothetical protein
MPVPSFAKFHRLGRRLFGPVIAPALVWLVQEAEKSKARSLLFIGREGYFLRPLAEHARSVMQIAGSRKSYHYLDVSRGFLFKLLLSDSENLDMALRHHFSGSLQTLLERRFFLSDSEKRKSNFGQSNFHVSLPMDAEAVKFFLDENIGSLRDEIKAKADAYIHYVKALADTDHLLFADVGFSGTIQKILGQLTGFRSEGLYFCRTADFSSGAPAGSHSAKAYWTESAKFGTGDPLVDYSLVLESLLTAPYGTLRDVDLHSPATDFFIHDDKTPHLKHFEVLESIVSGVRSYITDFVHAGMTPASMPDLVDCRRLYELQLKYDASPEMQYVRRLFEIDDSISGFGSVKPFNFLPGL